MKMAYSACCVLCLTNEALTYLNAFDDANGSLNIAQIISKHLWFELKPLSQSFVCGDCWNSLHNFHLFYNKLERIHNEELHTTDTVEQAETDLHGSPEKEQLQNSVDVEHEIKFVPNIEVVDMFSIYPLEEEVENKHFFAMEDYATNDNERNGYCPSDDNMLDEDILNTNSKLKLVRKESPKGNATGATRSEEQPIKRGRGRPPKLKPEQPSVAFEEKRPRGRPPKRNLDELNMSLNDMKIISRQATIRTSFPSTSEPIKRGRGRPPKKSLVLVHSDQTIENEPVAQGQLQKSVDVEHETKFVPNIEAVDTFSTNPLGEEVENKHFFAMEDYASNDYERNGYCPSDDNMLDILSTNSKLKSVRKESPKGNATVATRSEEQPIKRGRGRPPKLKPEQPSVAFEVKRPRGRPPKRKLDESNMSLNDVKTTSRQATVHTSFPSTSEPIKRGRGRPPKKSLVLVHSDQTIENEPVAQGQLQKSVDVEHETKFVPNIEVVDTFSTYPLEEEVENKHFFAMEDYASNDYERNGYCPSDDNMLDILSVNSKLKSVRKQSPKGNATVATRSEEQPIKRGRGRPPKLKPEQPSVAFEIKRPRGRPPKRKLDDSNISLNDMKITSRQAIVPTSFPPTNEPIKRGRGRPPKKSLVMVHSDQNIKNETVAHNESIIEWRAKAKRKSLHSRNSNCESESGSDNDSDFEMSEKKQTSSVKREKSDQDERIFKIFAVTTVWKRQTDITTETNTLNGMASS